MSPEKKFRPFLTLGTFLVFVALVVWRIGLSPDFRDNPQAFVFRGETMGTTWQVKVIAQSLPTDQRDAIYESVQDALDLVDEKMSTYKPDSELCQLNLTHSLQPQKLSPETMAVLELAKQVHKLTGGAFDPTVGPLVDAWGFGPAEAPDAPSEATIADLLESVGMEHLALDVEASSAAKSLPGLSVDLSAIAKGYAVDQVVRALEAAGYADFMVEVGGEIATRGHNERGEAFRIAVERPEVGSSQAIYDVVSMKDLAVATSGDYRNYREVDGVRISHTIDPRTGSPVRHRLASVSVIHPQCAYADAMATALTVMGPEAGLALATAEKLAAQFIVRTAEGRFERQMTASFSALLTKPGKE